MSNNLQKIRPQTTTNASRPQTGDLFNTKNAGEAGKKKNAYEAAQKFTINDIWDITNRNFDTWGIQGYQIFRHYQDPIKQMKEREFLANNKKGQKDQKHVTKKGSYLDYTEKLGKINPGPGQYKHWTSHYNTTNLDWVDPAIQQRNKKIKSGAKNSYIDQIIHEAEKRPTPGVGHYNLRKTDKQIEEEKKNMGKQKYKINERTDFLCENQYLSDANPGPGQYQPHGIRPQSHKQLLEPKDWIKKHKELQSARRFEYPCSSTYKPESCTYTTFSKLNEQNSKKEKNKNTKLFGTDARFKSIKDVKSKAFIITPGPNQYDLTYYWKGKTTKNEKTKKDWKNISKGIQKSLNFQFSQLLLLGIYYE